MPLPASIQIVDTVSVESKVAQLRYDEDSQQFQILLEQTEPWLPVTIHGQDSVLGDITVDSLLFYVGGGLLAFSSAITENVTTTSTAAGTLAVTTNATGRGKVFVSDGTKWQLAVTTLPASPTFTTPTVTKLAFASGATFSALTTAITANSTTTTEPAGSLAITTHATGVGKLFVSDGSKWQFVAVA